MEYKFRVKRKLGDKGWEYLEFPEDLRGELYMSDEMYDWETFELIN